MKRKTQGQRGKVASYRRRENKKIRWRNWVKRGLRKKTVM